MAKITSLYIQNNKCGENTEENSKREEKHWNTKTIVVTKMEVLTKLIIYLIMEGQKRNRSEEKN